MRRNTLNFVVDAVSLLVLLGMIATGMVIRFILPPGTGGRYAGGAAKTLWGMGRHDWGDVHYWLAVTIVVLLVVHTALHWTWVCSTIERLVRRGEAEPRKGSAVIRNLYGVAFLAAVALALGAFLWLASAKAVTGPGAGGGRGGGRGGPPGLREDDSGSHEPGHGGAGEQGHGQGWGAMTRPAASPPEQDHGRGWGTMTLSELEATTGIPVATFRQELGLPDTVTSDERLGRLRQQYGFQMSAVRDIIEKHRPAAGSQPAEQ